MLDYELLYSFEVGAPHCPSLAHVVRLMVATVRVQVRDFETDIGHVKKPPKPMRSTVSCGNVCKYTLSGLPPSTDYTAIAVRAKTAYGRSVLSTQLDVIRTQGEGWGAPFNSGGVPMQTPSPSVQTPT